MNIQYIDLFCGAGGLGEGFKQAGYTSSLHVDSDKWSINTVRLREIYYLLKSKGRLDVYYNTLRSSNGPFKPELFYNNDFIDLNETISKTRLFKIDENSVNELIRYIKSGLNKKSPFVIIGGPPCQAYSLAKRSRMRKPFEGLIGKELIIAEAENKDRVEKYLSDERHALFQQYLKIIYDLKPDAFVYENVPGILTAQKKTGENSTDKIINLFNNDLNKNAGGYDLISMDSHDNQTDQASIFPHGIKREFKEFVVDASEYGVPQKRKRFILIGIRSNLKNNKDVNFQKLFESVVSKYRNNEKVKVKDAIWDLPRVTSGKGNNYFWKKKYEKSGSNYTEQLVCTSLKGVFNHFARKHMEKDLERYRYFANYGKNNKKNANLFNLAKDRPDLLPEHKSAENILDEDGEKNRMARYVDRFKVLLKNEPATTITAHIAKDGHAFIHPLPGQNRSITVREAARLQSFPDDYAFCGPRTEQFKQVGNAVPVILAKVIASGIKKVLDSSNG